MTRTKLEQEEVKETVEFTWRQAYLCASRTRAAKRGCGDTTASKPLLLQSVSRISNLPHTLAGTLKCTRAWRKFNMSCVSIFHHLAKASISLHFIPKTFSQQSTWSMVKATEAIVIVRSGSSSGRRHQIQLSDERNAFTSFSGC